MNNLLSYYGLVDPRISASDKYLPVQGLQTKIDSSQGIPYIVLWFNVCNKELLALRNNFRVTKKFLIAKFDCIII